MDPILNRLGLVHIKDATIEAVQEIKDRKDGLIVPLKTRWEKFNTLIGGGLEYKNIITIGGISGSGKSSIANELETALFDYNPNENFVVLSFNFEMTNSAQVIRKLSFKSNLTVGELKSGNVKLNESQFQEIRENAGKIIKYRIYYAETSRTPDEMIYTIREFHNWAISEFGKDCGLIVFLDHTRLPVKKGKEQEMIDELQLKFVAVKKEAKRIIIQLSQLNRGIESYDRLTNPSVHFPMRSDIFGADSIYQSSDIVVCSHRPELLNIQSYGVNNYAVRNKVYIHAIKLRDGEPAPIRFINNLKYNRIDEDSVLPTPNESN